MIKTQVYDIVSNEQLTYKQQLIALAQLAESEDHTIVYDPEFLKAKEEHCICDLNEGNLPYRPRYIIPDYQKLIDEGSKFLSLKPAEDLLEACNNLLIMYHHVPSITSYPVYLGNLDTLLNKFVEQEDEKTAKRILKMFLLNIDRTLTDSFVHANIGPKDTKCARLILDLTEEMQLAIPNITLKYDEKLTSDDFALRCVNCMLKVAKPSFANHQMFAQEWTEDYAIASCYNGLKIAGGGYTLPRLRLAEVAAKALNIQDFMDNVLPYYVNLQLNFMDQRIKFLVEESSFFKSNFLVTEGFVKQENFAGMFGMVGLAECSNHLLGITDKKLGYGNNVEAEQLGLKIVQRLEELVNAHHAPYSQFTNHKYRLHAQVGIDTDGMEDAPGTRIPIGVEPTMIQQIKVSQLFHKYFPTGTGDIYNFEENWINTPNAVLDIIKGALKNGIRYFSGYLENTDVVRVTGYLVKRSELEKLDQHKQSINGCTAFGKGARDCSNSLNRKVQKVANSTSK